MKSACDFSKVKVLLWDIDGTLLDFKAAEKCAIRKCFEVLELGECTDEMIGVYSKINTKYWEKLERGEMTKPEILVGRFEEFFRLYDRDTAKAPAFNREYQVRLGDFIVFEEGGDTILPYFREKGYEQYAVTNGTLVAQSKKLKTSGLEHEFDEVFISENLGVEKPDKLFFDRLFEKIDPEGKLGKDEVLIIGDSLTSDMKGGNNAKILCCWYDPSGKEADPSLKLDLIIRKLEELKEVLK